MAQKNVKLPEHVAIIMDGNGRWGDSHYGKRTKGHIEGTKRVREIVRSSKELGIKSLRLWGYSTDNWKREQNEVNTLMWLFRRFIVREANELDAQSINVTFVGRRQQLPEQLQRVMKQLEERTEDNDGLRLEIALNYGGLQSVADAVNSIIKRDGLVTEESLMGELYPNISPPDLIIRTSGEMRTSGFQPLAVHAEWEFTKTLWPDFTAEEFSSILKRFGKRERRFGGVRKVV